jgi:hypothetical protein
MDKEFMLARNSDKVLWILVEAKHINVNVLFSR